MRMLRYNNLTLVPEVLRGVFDEGAEQCFFSSLQWYTTFTNHALDPGDEVRIYSLQNDLDSKQIVFPAVFRSSDRGFWRLRKLSSLSNYYTCLYGLLGTGNEDTQTVTELAASLANESPSWDALELKPLDVADPSFCILERCLRSAGFIVQTYFCFGNWFLDVNGRNYAEYKRGLPSKLRNTLERKSKQLARSGKANIAIVTGGEELEAAITAYNIVYLSSWKRPEPYPDFVPQLIRMCASQGALRLGILSVDGQPAAAQMWIVHNRKALIYKLAYDEQFAQLSVGTVLTAALMEHALDVDGVTEVDYLSGDDSYKRDWMSARRERWGILAMNPRTFRGSLAILRHSGGRAIKKAFLSITGRKEIFPPLGHAARTTGKAAQ